MISFLISLAVLLIGYFVYGRITKKVFLPAVLDVKFWVIVILIYYLLATIMPIDKIIGKLYPIFGVILIVMALGIIGGITFNPDYSIPELTLTNLHPKDLPM